ncbi:N-alpha-acetyltransferase 30, NatC catalytic subunit [Verticillium dahliae VDG1]|nr:N-alpha-acetyltransferase 30, NatC catalytic subunit [Verticillium dahliae VDG1]
MAAGSTTQNAQPQLLFVDGTFPELAGEMADYLHIADEVKPLLEDESKKDEALAKLVRSSSALTSVPEKEFTAASNLMIHLVMQSNEPKKHLPALCQAFSKPIATSPINGVGLSLNALTTVFNLIDPKNPIRFNVFSAILKFLKAHGMFDTIEPYLKHIPTWFDDWNTGEEYQRNMYVDISEVAAEAGQDEQSYEYLLKALRTFDADDKEELASEEAQELSLRAVKEALLSPTHLLFTDVRSIPSVQNLSETHPVWSQLLDIFAEQDLEDYNDFNDEHEGFVEKEELDGDRLLRKMRLLTFASLAAQTTSRRIEYASIAKALQVPSEDVELWAIDIIRAGLVEGRLSQQEKVFLVHKVTYRLRTDDDD